MKTKLIKILVLMLTIILLLGTSQVLAINPNDYKPNTIGEGSATFVGKAGQILGVINIVGIVCSVIVIAAVGIKYMLGSVEEKAEYKKTMTTYMIGAVLLFSGTTIPNAIYEMVNPGPYVYSEYADYSEYSQYTESKVIHDWCFTCNAIGAMCPARTGEVSELHAYGSQIIGEKHYCGHCDNVLSEGEQFNSKCDDCGKGKKIRCTYCKKILTESERKKEQCSDCYYE